MNAWKYPLVGLSLVFVLLGLVCSLQKKRNPVLGRPWDDPRAANHRNYKVGGSL
jgi:hypothetical protein